jgi:hypothetical protein
MKGKKTCLVLLIILLSVSLFAGEISLSDSGSFDITSRTSFGVNLDNPYKYGLKQELVNFALTLNLVPYQKLSNSVTATSAVGFIDLTLFNFDILVSKKIGYNAPGNLTADRYQTGELLAGIAYKNWIFQMNAGGNEPMWDPWNKGIQFVNDSVKFSWAYLDSMLDVKRTKTVIELKPEDCVVTQFTHDSMGATDQFGLNLSGTTIAALYNKEDEFGLNLKFATENSYDSSAITETNYNGLAAGIDAVITPQSISGLKIFASVGGSYFYGKDTNPDPLMMGTKIGYTMPLNDDISLEPFIGCDYGLKIIDDAKFGESQYEFSTGLTMRWPGQAGWFVDYIVDDEGRVFPGMSLAYSFYGNESDTNKNNHSVKFTMFEPRGDDGVFYGLGSEVIIDLVGLGKKDWTCLATVYADYEIPGVFHSSGKLIPWGTICYDYLPLTDVAGKERYSAMKMNLGVKLDNVISNTVLGLTWNSGNLIKDAYDITLGCVKAMVEIKF